MSHGKPKASILDLLAWAQTTRNAWIRQCRPLFRETKHLGDFYSEFGLVQCLENKEPLLPSPYQQAANKTLQGPIPRANAGGPNTQHVDFQVYSGCDLMFRSVLVASFAAQHASGVPRHQSSTAIVSRGHADIWAYQNVRQKCLTYTIYWNGRQAGE